MTYYNSIKWDDMQWIPLTIASIRTKIKYGTLSSWVSKGKLISKPCPTYKRRILINMQQLQEIVSTREKALSLLKMKEKE